ncbi:hypothetical protein LIER_10781 [Lithospermum erythrorhizon]|uniref:Uncharacterized protein n=1 Tax=Lithospermum erythrorhizon TaxID=34254 RepID=A0AAV3PKQ2_LITER
MNLINKTMEKEGSENKVSTNEDEGSENKKNHELTRIIEEQRAEICALEEKIEVMTKGIKMINSSTNVLGELLLQGKRSGDSSEIGFSEEHNRTRQVSPTRRWIAASSKPG